MSTDFPFVAIPDHLKKIIGEPDPGTRLYRAYGAEDDIMKWHDAIWDICQGPGSVSPGGVAAYVGVSRAAVYKRMKEGRLTAFLYHVTKDSRFIKDRKTLEDGGRPYGYIPVSECKAWAEELNRRSDLREDDYNATEKDLNDKFLFPPKGWRKKAE